MKFKNIVKTLISFSSKFIILRPSKISSGCGPGSANCNSHSLHRLRKTTALHVFRQCLFDFA